MITTAVQPALPLPPALSPDNRDALRGLVGRDWRDRAACLGRRPDDWFPPPSDQRAATRALAVCHDCPVTRACLAAGLLADEQGIWGGTTEDHRDAIRSQLAAGLTLDAALTEPGGKAAA